MSYEGNHYGYADAVNRRARIGVVVIAFLVAGTAWAAGAIGSDDTPPVTVLSAELIAPESTVEVTVTTTTVPAASSTTAASTTTSSTTTATTPANSTTSTTRPATTTTRPTTSTSTTTTTLPPTTTTTSTSTTTTTLPPTTTTTTTVPPTTTTTTIPVLGTIHIHELKGSDRTGNDRGPYARIEVVVRNDDDNNQRGVRVAGSFSGGYQGSVAGVTDNKGKVTFESGTVIGDSVTFLITNLTLPQYLYAPEDNRRDPSITVGFG